MKAVVPLDIATAIVLFITPGVFGVGCGLDRNPVSGEEVSHSSYTLVVDVQPPTALRTEETWGAWVNTVQVRFQTDFETGATPQQGDGNHSHKAIPLQKVVFGDEEMFIGETLVEGMRIALQSGHAEMMWRMDHDGTMVMHSDEQQTHHVRVTVEETITGHHPHGGPVLPYAKIHIQTETGDEIPLRPVQGEHGLRYEVNTDIPPGIYDLTVDVHPPTFMRSNATKDQWIRNTEALFQDYDFSSGNESDSLEINGMRVILQTGPPKFYGALGIGPLPMSGNETASFSVRLEVPGEEAPGEGEILPYCTVTMTLINDESGNQTTRMLQPMYGEQGFYYGENFVLPAGLTSQQDEDHQQEPDGHMH